jgi:hypothetical protein
MITAILFIDSLYAFGIIPFPKRYVTWFEHSRPDSITKICTGTIPNAATNHLFKTKRSNLRNSFLHPSRTLRA